jgi:hypothetical protein
MPNLLELHWWKHRAYGLLEVDVTVVRQFIAAHKARAGEARQEIDWFSGDRQGNPDMEWSCHGCALFAAE